MAVRDDLTTTELIRHRDGVARVIAALDALDAARAVDEANERRRARERRHRRRQQLRPDDWVAPVIQLR